MKKITKTKMALAGFVLLMGSINSAWASQWTWFGSLRTHLAYYDLDEEFIGGPNLDTSIRGIGTGDSGTFINLAGNSVVSIADYDDADFSIPKIELAYQWNSPVVSLRPIAGYQTYRVQDHVAVDSKTITSILYGLGVNLHLGNGKINMTTSMCTNPDQYGIKSVATPYADIGSAKIVDGDLQEARLLQSSLVINYKINDHIKFEGGYGYIRADQKVAAETERELESTIWYVNLPIYFSSNMELTPEIGTLDRGAIKENGDNVPSGELGRMEWISIRLAISF